MRRPGRRGERSVFAQFELLVQTKNRAGTPDDLATKCAVLWSKCQLLQLSERFLVDEVSHQVTQRSPLDRGNLCTQQSFLLQSGRVLWMEN